MQRVATQPPPSRPPVDLPSSARLDDEVRRRYAAAARAVEPALCCPTEVHDPDLLALLPPEILEVDYGCGDPSAWVARGETVLDLGSGSGKACYVCAQKVGATGRVIGLDANDEMLSLARRHRDAIARRLGYANVSFHKARIEDMALDLEAVDRRLRERPVETLADLEAFEAHTRALRRETPLVADDSVDVVVSNCVLNLVRPEEKERLFAEMARVIRRGGRAVISDIVCDEDPTPEILGDPGLWSGCISGAYREDAFLEAFERAGFHGIEIVARAAEPWQVLQGVEFRSVTVRAFIGKAGPCLERGQAVIYRGPWSQVKDDDGHVLRRGQRMAVCDKTFTLLTDPAGPYAGQIVPVPPRVEIPLESAEPFACNASSLRHPRETKGEAYRDTRTNDGPACATQDGPCC